MKLNLIHDIQSAYREIVDSMSRPGKINNLHEQASKATLEVGCLPSTLVLVQMLFDTEVKFKICSSRQSDIAKYINQLTYAKATDEDKADFILILNDSSKEEAENALRMANPGELLNPHKSATIIVEAESISNEHEWQLTGPGIAEESHVRIHTYENLLEIRNQKNAEYPLGIDLIFTDRESNILCIPRTTHIRKLVSA